MTTATASAKHTELFESLWWCSHAAMQDSVDSRADMVELFPDNGSLGSRGLTTPEEVTTYNWVLYLARRRKKLGLPIAAVHHSRSLEGGNRRTRRAGSGADVELAVEVEPGRWVDLILQAKRLYESASGAGRYREWKASQILAMRRWARDHGSRTAGMLLYNADIAPFDRVGAMVRQGMCHTRQLQLVGDPAPPAGEHLASPLGITVVLFPSLPTKIPPTLNQDGLAADAVNDFAFPFECLQCSAGVSGHPISRLSAVARLPEPPGWAAELLGTGRSNVVEESPAPPDRPEYSLVLPFVPPAQSTLADSTGFPVDGPETYLR
jgi:hypothetical protein